MDTLEACTRLERKRDIHAREMERKIAERGMLDAAWRSRLLRRRTEIDSRLAELRELMQSSGRRVRESKLTAPSSGTVDRLRVFTVGGMV